jgi:hypothetical protein
LKTTLALVAVLLISSHPSFIWSSLFMFGFFTLTVQGIVRLIKSRHIARFR